MRRFTLEEEQGLLFLLGNPGASWRPLPAKCGPSTYRRLASLGCVQLLQDGPMLKGRLTMVGRYFAVLLHDSGLVPTASPGTIARRAGTG